NRSNAEPNRNNRPRPVSFVLDGDFQSVGITLPPGGGGWRPEVCYVNTDNKRGRCNANERISDRATSSFTDTVCSRGGLGSRSADGGSNPDPHAYPRANWDQHPGCDFHSDYHRNAH